MDISVIIPTYNRKNLLRHTIFALINQGIDSYEVIICDDGSNDGTKETVEKLKNNFKLPFDLRYLWQQDLGFGLSKARNMGIQNANGDKIVMIDQDVIVAPYMLKKMNCLVQPKSMWYGKLKLVSLKFYNDKINDDVILNNFNIFEEHKHGIISSTLGSFSIIYRNNLIITNGFDEEFTEYGLEDSEYMCRLQEYGVRNNLNTELMGYHIADGAPPKQVSRSMQDRFHYKRNNTTKDGQKVSINKI